MATAGMSGANLGYLGLAITGPAGFATSMTWTILDVTPLGDIARGGATSAMCAMDADCL